MATPLASVTCVPTAHGVEPVNVLGMYTAYPATLNIHFSGSM